MPGCIGGAVALCRAPACLTPCPACSRACLPPRPAGWTDRSAAARRGTASTYCSRWMDLLCTRGAARACSARVCGRQTDRADLVPQQTRPARPAALLAALAWRRAEHTLGVLPGWIPAWLYVRLPACLVAGLASCLAACALIPPLLPVLTHVLAAADDEPVVEMDFQLAVVAVRLTRECKP